MVVKTLWLLRPKPSSSLTHRIEKKLEELSGLDDLKSYNNCPVEKPCRLSHSRTTSFAAGLLDATSSVFLTLVRSLALESNLQ
jgi:hypothetical protein